LDYNQALAYLDSLQPASVKMELGPMSEAVHIMGEPQSVLRAVHIGGTNGKGSTAAFLATILQQSGYSVGLYTSPHLVDVRERIQIDRRVISEEEISTLITRIRDTLPDDRMLSYFEMLTLASLIHFRDKEIDVAVYETGLGGRLDATNVISPQVVIITPVSIDHTKQLGSTIREIAAEKCGIIKRGVPTVAAYQPPDAMEAIRRACDDAGSPLILATPDEIKTPLGLPGDHQRQNAACAVEAASLLAGSGIEIRNVEAALACTKWPGRIDVVSERPQVILDGAHNVAGAETLASYVRARIPRERAVLLIGVMADKDFTGIMRQLSPFFREVIVTETSSARSASPKDLAAAARSSDVQITMERDVPSALKSVLARISREDTLVVSGSLTVVGQAMSYLDKVGKEDK